MIQYIILDGGDRMPGESAGDHGDVLGVADATAPGRAAVPATATRVLRALAGRGLEMTHPRRLIAERLAARAEVGADFGVQELCDDVQRIAPGVGRATMYRAVEVLVELGLLDRLAFADGTHRFRVSPGEHRHYVTCTRCRRSAAVSVCLPGHLFARVAEETGYHVEGHSIEVFGRCPNCSPLGERRGPPAAAAPPTAGGARSPAIGDTLPIAGLGRTPGRKRGRLR